MSEYEVVVEELAFVLYRWLRVILLHKERLLNGIELLVELLSATLDVVKSIECVHELHHRLGILLVLIWVTLDEERQRQVVEHVLVQFVLSVIR